MANRDLWQDRIKKGMMVVAKNGTPLGSVKDVGEDSFWLDRTDGFDTAITYDQVDDVLENIVHLKISADQIDQSGIAHEEGRFKPVSAG